MSLEIFKEIVGYEGYFVSNFGRVKSLRFNQTKKERILKNCTDKYGYLMVTLYSNKKGLVQKVHRLVALAFIPNPENKPEVNHKDGNKQNNNVDNLEWNTSKENIDHAIETKLSERKGSKNGMAKLTEEQVLEIRAKYIPRVYTSSRLAEEYSISETIILFIINRRIWKHI